VPGSCRGCPACFGHGQGRNLRTGEPVDIRYKGKRRPAAVEVLTQEPDVVEHYAIIARDNHAFARFNQIGFDRAVNPDPTDLHLAWATGARVIRPTPRLPQSRQITIGTTARRETLASLPDSGYRTQ
jgi:hypothetical protein